MVTKIGIRGEVWFAQIKGKSRPIVIVSDDQLVAEIDHLVATITSKQPRNKYDVTIEYWKVARLDMPSVVRCSKLNTLHYKELKFRIGKLHKHDLDRVLSTVRSYF